MKRRVLIHHEGALLHDNNVGSLTSLSRIIHRNTNQSFASIITRRNDLNNFDNISFLDNTNEFDNEETSIQIFTRSHSRYIYTSHNVLSSYTTGDASGNDLIDSNKEDIVKENVMQLALRATQVSWFVLAFTVSFWETLLLLLIMINDSMFSPYLLYITGSYAAHIADSLKATFLHTLHEVLPLGNENGNDEYLTLTDIVGHQQVHQGHPDCNGSSLNLRILWENGEETYEPLNKFAADAPVESEWRRLNLRSCFILCIHYAECLRWGVRNLIGRKSRRVERPPPPFWMHD